MPPPVVRTRTYVLQSSTPHRRTRQTDTMATITAAELGAMGKDEFVAKVGGIYEHSPWVAERAHAAGPFESLTAIHKAMSAVVLVRGQSLASCNNIAIRLEIVS